MTKNENADVGSSGGAEQNIDANKSNPYHPFSREIVELLQRHLDDHIVASSISTEVAMERATEAF